MRVLAAIVGVYCVGGAATAAPIERSAERAFVGRWEGSFEGGARVPFSIDLALAENGWLGRFTALDQRAFEHPIDSPIRIQETSLHFELLGGIVALDGSRDGDTIRGRYRDLGLPDAMGRLSGETTTGTFTLRRGRAAVPPYRRREVTFSNGDVTLAGSLFLPANPRPCAAVVTVHASGPSTRADYAFMADQFARAGIANLVYDKRGTGASTGDWRSASFEDLADDALAAIRLLARTPGIDPARIGLSGQSQGGIVAPLAAVRGRAREVAFIVASSTIAGDVYRQDLYRVGRALEQQPFSPAEKAHALELFTLFIDVARGSRSPDEWERANAAAKGTAWHQWLALSSPADWTNYARIGNFDTLPVWSQVEVPTLLVFGERDALVPASESVARIEEALERGRNPTHLAVLIPRANHNLAIDAAPGSGFPWFRGAPGLPGLLTRWVAAQVARPDR